MMMRAVKKTRSRKSPKSPKKMYASHCPIRMSSTTPWQAFAMLFSICTLQFCCKPAITCAHDFLVFPLAWRCHCLPLFHVCAVGILICVHSKDQLIREAPVSSCLRSICISCAIKCPLHSSQMVAGPCGIAAADQDSSLRSPIPVIQPSQALLHQIQ